MRRNLLAFLTSIGIIFFYAGTSSACTTILATKGATKDGSVIISHSDDDELGDQRIIYVPAADHQPGSKRPVYYDACSFEVATVRYIGTSRGPGYDTPGSKTEPLGYIPQVEHTYSYFDGNYGIMNEHQLMFVNQARGWLPDSIGGVCWFGPDKPYLTTFVPFYVGMTDLPTSYQTGTTETFDRSVAWWAFNFVANWASIKFSYMKEDILTKQKKIEGKEFSIQEGVDREALRLHEKNPALAKEYLTTYCNDNANSVVSQWWNLADMLIAKYNDGYVNIPTTAQEIGYPEWWLKEVGYDKGPISYKRPVEADTKNPFFHS